MELNKLIPNFLRRSRGPDPLSNSVNSIFGSIGNSGSSISGNLSFIPTDSNGSTTEFSSLGEQAQWMGLFTKNQQRKAYNVCSPLATVIDKLAQADTNGILSFVNESDGSPKENWRKNPKLLKIMKRIKNPNPFQTWEEFNLEQVVLSKIYGYCVILPIVPSGFERHDCTSLWNIDTSKITPIVNEDFDLYSLDEKKKNPISKFEGTFLGQKFSIDANEVIIINDGSISSDKDENYLPISKIYGLDFAISNICAAMEADNVLLKKKGPLGVFSYDPKPDMAGWQPMTKEQSKEIQNDLKKYGLGLNQLQYIISKLPMKWNPMSFNVAELMTKETFRQGVDSICDRFSYPAELMSGKNATYENRSSAERYLYNNNIIPFSIRRISKYNEFFGLEETLLRLTYSHVAALQEDVVKSSQAEKFQSEALDTDWKAGIITINEYRVKKKMKAVEGMDIYYPEWLEKNKTEDKKLDNVEK